MSAPSPTTVEEAMATADSIARGACQSIIDQTAHLPSGDRHAVLVGIVAALGGRIALIVACSLRITAEEIIGDMAEGAVATVEDLRDDGIAGKIILALNQQAGNA